MIRNVLPRPGKRMGAAAIIPDEDRRVLLVKHTCGRRNRELPGGCVEPDESAANAVVREVREETGLRVTPVRLTGIYHEADIDMHQFAFLCDIKDEGVPGPGDSEIEECGFFAVDDLPRPNHSFVGRRVGGALVRREVGVPESLPRRTWLD